MGPQIRATKKVAIMIIIAPKIKLLIANKIATETLRIIKIIHPSQILVFLFIVI